MDEELRERLDGLAEHMAHLQRRIDIVHALIETLVPHVISMEAKLPPMPDSEIFRESFAFLMKAYAQSRDEKISRFSEFPFLKDEQPDP